jgi:serine/threonine-protein kinase
MILAGQLASDAEVKRFHTEAEAAASLDHPNIVPIYEVGVHEGQHYFSMQLIQGASLGHQIGRFTQDPRAAVGLLAKVARAVHYAHQRGIMHRDLKPSNILVDANGEPHVTDFGLAKRVDTQSDLTLSGAVIGTPQYMAPEQASGRARHLTTAADVYGLGAVLYHLLTGRPPFDADNDLEVLHKVVAEEPTRPSAIAKHLDRDLETICLKCLDKDPAHRYGSGEALAEDLERWLRHEPVLARRTPVLERTVKWIRRRPAVAGLLAALVAVAILGLVAVLWQWHAAEQARKAALDEAKARAQAETEALRQRDRSADLLSLAQTDRGVRMLEEGDGMGLLYLLQARETVENLSESKPSRSLLWAGWYEGLAKSMASTLDCNQTLTRVTFSPDAKWLACGTERNEILILDRQTRRPWAVLKTGGQYIHSASFTTGDRKSVV